MIYTLQKDGSTLLTYNADCAECDWRINKVNAQEWPVGSKRPIYLLSGACTFYKSLFSI